MAKKNVLFVAYQFPPLAIAGSYRPFKFAKYLKQHSEKINPIVLTLAPSSYGQVYQKVNLDEAAEDEIKKLGIQVHHCPTEQVITTSRIKQFISIYFNLHKGNEAKAWKASFEAMLQKIVREEKIDLVYVTCPPFSIGTLVRRALKQYKIPYIADMRDNWSLWVSKPYGSRIHYQLSRRLEQKLYQKSAATVAVTAQHFEDLKAVIASDTHKINFIPNAFELSSLATKKYPKQAGVLRISYLGSFYYDPSVNELLTTKWWRRKLHRKLFYWPRKERWIYRSPHFFFRLLCLIKEHHPEIKIQVKFAGNKEQWLPGMIKDFGLEEEVKILGYLTGDALKQLYDDSDLLLVTSVKVDGGKDPFIASKSYEYIKSGKKVLGIVAEGAQKDFLVNSGNAIVVDADHPEAMLEELVSFAQSTEVEVNYHEDYLKQFSIDVASRKMEALMLAVAN